MAHNILMILIIALTFSVVGYIAYSNQHTTKEIVQQFVPSRVYQVFETGDIGSITSSGFGPNSHTTTYQYADNRQNTSSSSMSNKMPVSAPTNESTISTKAGQTYGQTSLYSDTNSHLGPNTYLIGTPVNLGGTWKLIIPNTCVLINGQTQCQYVTPPIFTYTLKVTCKIPQNDHCTMRDILQTKQTDGNGGWYYKWDTSAETGLVSAGQYLVTNTIDSNVLDSNGVPIPDVQSLNVYIVD